MRVVSVKGTTRVLRRAVTRITTKVPIGVATGGSIKGNYTVFVRLHGACLCACLCIKT